jgi:hypothetical protein
MTLTTSVVNHIVDTAQELHKCGTFGRSALAALAKHLSKRHIRCSAETGSGASTLLFSHCSDQHIVFSIDSGGGSVVNIQASPLLCSGRVTWIEGPTQLTLPTYRFQHKLQAALIDGPHAYPFPDLEYYYLYQQLETGSLLVIDDIQIPTIHNLFDFLRSDRMFVLEEVVDTTAFFTRTGEPMFCPIGDSWWEQQYNKTPLVSTPVQKTEGIPSLNGEQEALLRTIQLQETALSAKDEEIGTLKGTLDAIYNSHGWKALSFYYRLRDKLLPSR